MALGECRAMCTAGGRVREGKPSLVRTGMNMIQDAGGGAADDGKREASRLKLWARPQGPWGGGLGEGGTGNARGGSNDPIAWDPFFVIFGVQKIIKKSIPQKLDFFATFCNFQTFFVNFLTILGRFWDPHGFIFG